MADGKPEINADKTELAADSPEAVQKSAMEHALNDVQSDSTVSGAKSGDSSAAGKLGLPSIDIGMHESIHAGVEAGAQGVKGGAAALAHEIGQAAMEGAKGGATIAHHEAGHAAVEAAVGAAKGGAAVGEKATKSGEQTNKDSNPQDGSENPPDRNEVLNDLEKWINDQGSNLNQKELADKLVEFAKDSEFQWNAMREMGADDTVDSDTFQTYSRFTDLLMNKLTDQGERDRIKDQIPWVLRPGE